MSTYTLASAITRIRTDYLDDADKDRWSDDSMTRHVHAALQDLWLEYVESGGKRFARDDTYSSSSGKVDLSSESPPAIHGVAVLQGNGVYPIRRQRKSQRSLDVTTDHTFEVHWSEPPVALTDYSTQNADPLVGDGTAALVGTWPGFEELVCVRAALSAAVIDGEIPVPLRRLDERYTKAVLRHTGVSKGYDLPRSKVNSPYRSMRYDYNERTKKLEIYLLAGRA